MMEEEFEEAMKDGEFAEEEYEELKKSYDEVHHLMYKLMGGSNIFLSLCGMLYIAIFLN